MARTPRKRKAPEPEEEEPSPSPSPSPAASKKLSKKAAREQAVERARLAMQKDKEKVEAVKAKKQQPGKEEAAGDAPKALPLAIKSPRLKREKKRF
jgi:hypothetical protein